MMSLFALPVLAAALSAVTSNPSNNFFVAGHEAKATLTAKGLAAGEKRPVRLEVYDFTYTNRVATVPGEIVADEKGEWRGEFTLPSDRYGVYLVRPVAAGLELPKRGTVPKGAFTYAVLADPSEMPEIDLWDTFLGLHGGSYSWMYQRGGLGDARKPSEDRFIVANLDLFNREKDFWKSFLTNEAVQAKYRADVTGYVKAAVAAGGGKQKRRFYEPTWEANLKTPNAETLVKVHQIAWEVIHELDPDAYVGAPTSAGINDLAFLRSLFDLGLAKYMNAFAVHPYIAAPPEANGLVDTVRSLKRMLREYMGRDVPMIGTESGLNEPNSPLGEKTKLTGQLRQNLILFGEGFLWNLPFYGYDFGADANNQDEGDYGVCYNPLYPKHRWGPGEVQPRPVFGALAAFGRLTEGHRPTCPIEWLGETVLGYAFADKSDSHCVIALWDWGERGTEVELPVGRDAIDVADVMGNVTRKKTTGGTLKLTLSEYPQYVLDANSAIWGKAAQAKLKWGERKYMSDSDRAPVGIADLAPSFASGGPGVAVTLENRTDEPHRVALETRIPGEPDARVKRSVSLAARQTQRIEIAFDGFTPDPTVFFDVEVRVVPEKGMVATAVDSFNFLPVPSSFAFDGGKTVSLGYDARFLTFDIFIPDSTPTNGWTGWDSWKGDSVQVGLAKSALKKRTQNDLADNAAEAKSEITFALTPNGPEMYRTITWDVRRFPCDTHLAGQIDLKEAPLTVEKSAKGFRYRASVPWAFLNLSAPKPGDTFRFAFQFNDREPGNRFLKESKGFELKQAAPKKFGWGTIR
ncbi:MAG TPA: hypothetical protein PLJ32_01490 [Kiritimatiellia bacterium]|jgi:hypothetical protein|nr:hypothetical protein [Kiritimatiellia bacterium]HOR97625.1 hypothetical protein [Kiritimatiellia bacterium]HPW74630.1 hypothetical protein [Kiritimatiellia bacterium]